MTEAKNQGGKRPIAVDIMGTLLLAVVHAVIMQGVKGGNLAAELVIGKYLES